MIQDRRSDGPTLLQASATSSRRWGRRSSTTTVRVTSRRLVWEVDGAVSAVDWTEVVQVSEQDGALRVEHLDAAGLPQVLVVQLEGPMGYLVAEDVSRRAAAAARSAARRGDAPLVA